ncbi:hypothetical protein H0H93_000095 [Arthromyces matolae]|nr:hypothetical protein H0H93_000095 [Arthromyces matolae]
MSRYLQNEVVDDSEPERDELRYKERFGQEGRIKRAPNAEPPSVIDGDDTVNGRGTMNASMMNRKTLLNSDQQRNKPLVIQEIPNDIPSDDTHSATEEDEPKVSLAQFAYRSTTSTNQTTTAIARPGLSRQASSASSINIDTKRPKKRTHRFADAFSDAELARISKCVSCDTRWTARKSVPQKMLHIHACAKKKFLSDETIKARLRKEIDSCMPESTVNKGKGKAVEPQTFLEEMVAETIPRKKARRVEAEPTVKMLSQTRELILERAKAVISSASSSTIDQEPLFHTQAMGSSQFSPPSSTQAFGASKIGKTHLPKRTLFNHHADADIAPPSPPAFAPSRLGCAMNSEQVLLSKHLPSYPLDIRSNASKHSRTRSPGTPTWSPLSTPAENTSDLMYTSTSDWGQINDDAFLHYHPEVRYLSNDIPSTPQEVTPSHKQVKHSPDPSKGTPSKTRTSSPKKNTPSLKQINHPSTVTTPKTTVKSQTIVKPVKVRGKAQRTFVDQSPENLESKLKEKIMQDTTLHLRVLRYEPIHFDLFLQLMLGDSHSNATEKERVLLRSVLDKQAIHFYGSERTKRRRPRRKSS